MLHDDTRVRHDQPHLPQCVHGEGHDCPCKNSMSGDRPGDTEPRRLPGAQAPSFLLASDNRLILSFMLIVQSRGMERWMTR